MRHCCTSRVVRTAKAAYGIVRPFLVVRQHLATAVRLATEHHLASHDLVGFAAALAAACWASPAATTFVHLVLGACRSIPSGQPPSSGPGRSTSTSGVNQAPAAGPGNTNPCG